MPHRPRRLLDVSLTPQWRPHCVRRELSGATPPWHPKLLSQPLEIVGGMCHFEMGKFWFTYCDLKDIMLSGFDPHQVVMAWPS